VISNDQIIPRLGAALGTPGISVEAAQLFLRAAEDPRLLEEARKLFRFAEQEQRQQSGTSPQPSPISPSDGPVAAIATLFEILTSPNPDPEEVVKCSAQIVLNYPTLIDDVNKLARAADENQSSGATPPDSGAPNTLQPVGIAKTTGLAAVVPFVVQYWQPLCKFLDKSIPSLTSAVPISPSVLAISGALGGLAYGILTFEGGWLPGPKQAGGSKIMILGLVGKAAFGALAAYLARTLSPALGDSNTLTSMSPSGSLIFAFVAGMLGANLAKLKLDWPVLAQSVGKALRATASPEIAEKIDFNKITSIAGSANQALAKSDKP
jgi:hypothetical protein